jgi:hypothetical protein
MTIGADKHPDLEEVLEDYALIRDCYRGARAVKSKDVAYLPPTAGMVEDGLYTGTTTGTNPGFNTNSMGYKRYAAYLNRAYFPEFVEEAAEKLVGLMHREPASIKLPAQLEPMRKVATKKGESLLALLRRINLEQLLTGRIGLLVDVAQNRQTPHLVTYVAERVINWDDETLEGTFGVSRLSMAVVDETRRARGAEALSTRWESEPRFRMLFLAPSGGDGAAFVTGETLVYKTFLEVRGEQGPVVTPQFAGRPLQDIPFTFIGATDLTTTPGIIPMLKLANVSLLAYRGEADYRNSLFQQGQDTLVRIGHTPDETSEQGETRVGAGSVIDVPLHGDAKFIGVNGEGLPEQAKALERDYARAGAMGSRLVEPHGSQAESGEALRIRVAAATASLRQIALTGAAGLESALKTCARWIGANEDEVEVIPNFDFAETREEPRGAGDIMDAKLKGLPISQRSIHRWLAENDFTRLTYEDELKEIGLEKPLVDPALARGDAPKPEDDSAPEGGAGDGAGADEGEDE